MTAFKMTLLMVKDALVHLGQNNNIAALNEHKDLH